MADLTIKRNDLLPVLTLVARDSVGPVDLDGATALFRMVNVLNGAIQVDESADISANVTFTVSGATFTANGHPLNNSESVTVKTTGTLPGGLSSSTEYFIVNASTNTLGLSLTKGGIAITTSSGGTGTHTLIMGRVGYTWAIGDTDTAGTYFGEIQSTVSGQTLTYPNTGQFLIEVLSDLV